MGAAVAIISAVGSLASTGYSIYAANRAAKENKAATQLEQAQRENAVQREKVKAIRLQRIERARAANIAAQTGVLTPGTSATGGIDSTTSQLASNLGFTNEQLGLSRLEAYHLGKAGSFNAQSNLFGSISNVFGTVYSQSGGLGQLFRTNQTQQPRPFSPILAA